MDTEVSTLPSIYFSEYFDNSTWRKITSAGWDGIVDNFIDIYESYLIPPLRCLLLLKVKSYSIILVSKKV